MTEDEMVGWHHQLNEHEFEQAARDVEGQGSLVCCSPWGHKESDINEQLKNKNIPLYRKQLTKESYSKYISSSCSSMSEKETMQS